MFRKRCRQKKLLTLLLFMRTVCQSVKQREKAHTFGERYTPLRKKNVMYVIGEVILLPRLLIWNIHRIVIVKAGPAQWQITDHRLEIFDLHIS